MEYLEQACGDAEDQRLFERIPAQFSVKYTDLHSHISGEAVLSDISAYGLGMVAGAELPPSADLEMWLNIPDRGQPLYTRGKVVWCRPESAYDYRMGISLENTGFMNLSRIMRLY